MKYVVAAALLILTLLFCQTSVGADPAIPAISVGIRGSVSTYSMSDMNVAINDVNDVLVAKGFDELDSFGSGLSGGGELRIRILRNVALSATIDYLFESSKVGLENVGEQFKELQIHASTVPITGRVLYVIANSKNPKLVYTLGAGMSYLWLGRLRTESAETIPAYFPSPYLRTADGKGIGLLASSGVEYFVRPWFSVGGELSYRHAKISELTYNDNGAKVLLSNGEKMSLDFSGVCFSSCFRFHL